MLIDNVWYLDDNQSVYITDNGLLNTYTTFTWSIQAMTQEILDKIKSSMPLCP